MKQKIVLWLAVVALLVVVGFMVNDFFKSRSGDSTNPYEYNIDKLRQIDSSLIGYKQINQIQLQDELPRGIAIDENNQIYITGKGRLSILSNDLDNIKSFDIDYDVYCIAVADNKIYLGAKDHIVIVDSEGKLVGKWEPVNEKSVLTSIAVSNNFVYVADAGNRIVYQYGKDGVLSRKIGAKDDAKGVQGFIIPSPYFDLQIGNYCELWVVNPGRHSFEKYNETGEIVSQWERTSMTLEGFSGCCNPSHFAMLSDGSFVTSEKGIERVKVHSPTGDFKTVVAAPQIFTEGTKGIDLAVDSDDKIFVLDPIMKIVRVFVKKIE